MVRAALQTRGRLNRGPRKGVMIIPAASVVLMSCLALLPVVAYRGGWPDFGFMTALPERAPLGKTEPLSFTESVSWSALSNTSLAGR